MLFNYWNVLWDKLKAPESSGLTLRLEFYTEEGVLNLESYYQLLERIFIPNNTQGNAVNPLRTIFFNHPNEFILFSNPKEVVLDFLSEQLPSPTLVPLPFNVDG